MPQQNRRSFLTHSAALATLGVVGHGRTAYAEPTAGSGELGDYGTFLAQRGEAPVPASAARADWQPTEDNIRGPYYRKGAPYRGKVTPPLEPGDPLVIRGRVWAHDTRQPLALATLDIWQANAAGRYDNDDPRKPPAKGLFLNRARLVSNEEGEYEFETIHPGRYQTGADVWRPSHIHYLVQHPGYRTLVTQLYFQGDPYNGSDEFIKPSLIIDPETVKTPHGTYRLGTFDIVLAKG